MNRIAVGNVKVHIGAYEGGGLTPEQLAEMASDKIVGVADSAPREIREQAYAFKDRLRTVLTIYFRKMAESERSRIAEELRKGGHVEIAGAIMRI